MWLIPIAVGVLVYFGSVSVFAVLSGLEEGRGRADRPFAVMRMAGDTVNRWIATGADIDSMIKETVEFNERHAESGQVIMLFRNGEQITPSPLPLPPPSGRAIGQVLDRREDATAFGRVTVNAHTVGDYRAVFYSDIRFVEGPPDYRRAMFNDMLRSFVIAAVMVTLMSLYLTRFVFKRILRALGILTDGVRQIRDGNLDYRIRYPDSDEFTPVCDDFNQMAGHLMAAAETKARDEQSRRELIAGISHDLRTPLTSIKAYIEGLEQGIAATPEARKRYIDTIKNKAGDLEHIIEQLFLFSKLDTGGSPYRIERADLGAVVSEVVSGISGEYGERGLDIQTRISDTDLFVNMDAMQTRYVLINIFENSLKYKHKERGRVIVEARRDGGEAALSATDDGPGVPEDALPKLMDLFYTNDGARSNPGKGSGLGLAIVAKIIKQFGGKITADNAPGGGLKIEIRLPEAP